MNAKVFEQKKEDRTYTRVTSEDRRSIIHMFLFSASIISCLAPW